MQEPMKIVCIGGGYVSIFLMRKLRRAIRQGLVQLFVIDRNNFHTFHGLVPEMLAGKIQPGQVISPARRLFRGADFHNAEVKGIDAERKVVILERILDQRTYELPYDQLVVGVGSRSDLSRYRGVAEHAMQLKSYWDCFTVRNHILSKLEMADDEYDETIRRRLLTFVVVGGNYAGIETTAEVTEFLLHVTRKEYPQISPEEIRVVLVHSGDHILPELKEHYPKLAAHAQKYLQKQSNLELKLNTRLESATPNEVLLSNGETIPTRSIISCTGTAQSPLLDQLQAERDEYGRIRTDEYGRVRGFDNVWSAGDCAAMPHPKGGDAPPLAIYAMTGGELIGKNLLRLAKDKPLKPYRFTGLGDACVLGTHHAVGQVKGLQVTGLLAWITWRAFMIYYLPTWDRRLRTLSDWILTPIVGRDIVSVRPAEPRAASQRLYEPGQIIAQQGRPAIAMYAIRRGTVELINEQTEVVTTLQVGDHFAGREVLAHANYQYTARAITQVEMLEIPAPQVDQLHETFGFIMEGEAS